MHHEATLIATVAMGFVLAFVFGFAASRLRLPPLIGYLVAGVAVGPFTPGFVADAALAAQLAEMGVILLMFGVGLHFSVADLMAVRRVAIPGAIGQIVLATALGAGLAMVWGWSLGAGLVFGLSLSVASTVVLLRALEDRNALDHPNGRIAVGWLIVEDLVTVLALVLLPALSELLGGRPDPHATPGGSVLLTLGITLLKVAAFVALAVVLGPKVVPWLLKQVARTGSRELFTLSVLAIAMGIAYGSAELFGVSFALGAFFAGVVLNESEFSHRAAANSLPLQDAFAILFFVSVGMLFDPSIVVREPFAIIAVLLVIVLGKSIAALGVVVALGYPVATALTVSASLAQIGEFSFILAGLGKSAGLLPQEAFDLILAGALLSITLNPVCFAAVDMLGPRIAAVKSIRNYGARRLAALQTQLTMLRERTEAREEARSLQMKNLVDLFPIFGHLDHQAREELLVLFQPRMASPGDRVLRKGDRPDAAYFISEGAVQVDVGNRTIRLAQGEFFGEMALLSGERRSADVTAVDFCKFLTLDRRDFRTFLGRYPQLRAHVGELAAERARANRAATEAAAATS
ncbi:cation:proton antiporter [Reyranella sp. CPCC 100927]|uniref:cation:proton antiporter domain-containing protein n=1 Tax=Reyranella sp. CPCC 100927 TaxID=2599616 RepID=UPI0011B68F74|nr:cation:proton antiporter [Reyranella sp. CPCC 100927]TWS97333.1 cyclic nucleotide-binding domain-containing protein [Reyranella sp. CPCC 100927]